MSFDDIIILVKESINTHGDIFQNDEIILDSNAVDHIADDIATALCGARDEPADVPVRHGHWRQTEGNWFECAGKDGCGYYTDSEHCGNYCPDCGAKMDGKENEE